jgi:diacylglycerol kinase (ATP)
VARDIDDQSPDDYAKELGRSRDLLGVTRYLRSGEFLYQEEAHNYATRAWRVETDPALPVNIDGEFVDRSLEVFLLVQKPSTCSCPKGETALRDVSEGRPVS